MARKKTLQANAIARNPVLAWVIWGLGMVGLYEGWNLATDHLQSPGFSEHAKFHAIVSGIYLAVLSLILMGLVAAVRNGRKHLQLLLLVFVLLALPGGPLLAGAIIPAGAPPAGAMSVAWAALVVSMAVSVVMLIGMKRTPSIPPSEGASVHIDNSPPPSHRS